MAIDPKIIQKLKKLHYFLIVLIIFTFIASFWRVEPDGWPAMLFLVGLIGLYDIGIIIYLRHVTPDEKNKND